MAKKAQQARGIGKVTKRALGIVIIVGLISSYLLIALFSYDPQREPELGVTFSKKFSQYLGLDWRENYRALLDEVGVRYLRIPTYWDEVEPVEGRYDFSDVNWMIDEAAKRNAKVTLVLGMRQPRWPECHLPQWAEELNEETRAVKVLQLVLETVERFRLKENIEVWQVENEPLLEFFGECPRPDRDLIQQEIRLVKSLDSRPVMVTASGELSFWYPEALWGDILGSTMYRTTWSGIFGYTSYWWVPASLYRVKAAILGQDLDQYWIAELQAEPWFPGDPLEATLEEMYRSMSPQQLVDNVEYGYRVNPGRMYLWGAEWWYYTREVLGTNEIWETVKRLDW